MRLLVVEDDESVAQFLKKGLEEERYVVDVAPDGEIGLRQAQEISYDLIILDIMLPKLDGFSVCRALRDRSLHTPILLLTVRDSTEDTVHGLDCGADDYLSKPFAFAVLLARARALLRRGTAQPPGRLTAGPLQLDAAAHRAWRGQEELILTTKEYAILEYLLRNRDRVLTRTAIIEHVWNHQYDSMTNIVDVHIRALRTKIDESNTPSLITTVRGIGYVIHGREHP